MGGGGAGILDTQPLLEARSGVALGEEPVGALRGSADDAVSPGPAPGAHALVVEVHGTLG